MAFVGKLNISGWWYTYPSEKYEFVNGKDDIPYMENKSHVPNHQPDGDLWMFTANISQHALDPHFFHKPLVELLRSSSPRSPALQRPREYQ